MRCPDRGLACDGNGAAADAQRGGVLRALLRVAVQRGHREGAPERRDAAAAPGDVGERLRALLELRLDARDAEAA